MNLKAALVVDDSPTLRKMVMFALKKNYKIEKVFQAGDGLEALEVLASNEIDFIICDINMPNMNGLELLFRIKKSEDFKNIPIVMLTTEGRDEDINRAKSMGADGYAVKPFKPDTLKKELDPALKKYGKM